VFFIPCISPEMYVPPADTTLDMLG